MGTKTTDGIFTSADSRKDAGHRRRPHARRTIILVGVVNLLVGGHVWAAFSAPSELIATSVCSNSVSLSWVDPNPPTSGEQSILVQRSTRSLNKRFSTIASLPAYAASYTDTNVQASTTNYYRVVTVSANKHKFRSAPITVVTPAPLTVSELTTADVPDSGSSSYSVSVAAGTACGWSAKSMDPWITISSGGTGTGEGTITLSIAENTSTNSRTGTVFVASKAVRVSQVGKNCNYTLSPTSTSAAASGASGSFTVSTGGGCKWTAVADVSWIHTSSAGTGSGTVNYTVDSNVSTATRTGTASVGGRTFTITQAAGGVTITTSSSPSAGGTTSGGGTFANGSTATVVATPYACYSFVNWTENGVVVSTSTSYSLTATGNRTLVANFTQPAYAITTSSSPIAGGTTSGGGTRTCGNTVTVSATANAGYNFVNWVDNGTVVSTSANYSFTAAGNRTLVANFSTVPTYTITTSSTPAAGGTASGGGISASGATVTVVATPNSCYSFVSWTENGAVASTSTSYSFTVTGNRTLVANFSQMTYTIATGSSPSTGGTVSGGGNKACGSSVTISAVANAGYNFVNWTESGTVVSTSANYSFTVGGNRTLVANFSAVPTYTIATSSSPAAGGATSGGGATFTSGTTATVIAAANSGYDFVNWTENGVQVSPSASYSFTVTGNRSLVANFTSTSSGLWAMTVGGTGVDSANAVGTDAAGNIFVAGYFNSSANFGGTTLTSAGAADIFVAKYSPNGTLLWAKRFGGTGDDQAMALAVNRSSGEVAVTGYFSGTAAFGSVTYTSSGGRDIFLVKLAGATGAASWSKQIGGQWGVDAEDIGYGVAIDPRNGDVVLTGQLSGWIDVGFGWVITTSSSSDTLLARLSSAGAYQWAKTFVANGVDRGTAVAADASGNILLAGTVSGSIDLGGGALPLGGWSPDTYVAKLTSAGAHIWSVGFGNEYYTGVGGIAVDASGNVAITGFFSQTINFGTGNLAAINTSGYVVKLAAANGAAVWSRAFLGSANAAGNAVAFDGSGNVMVTGSFYINCDFGGGAYTAPSNIHDGFVAKYANATGSHLSSQRFGGVGDDRGFAVAVDATGNTLVTGTTGGGDFSGVTLPTAGSNDIFLMRLAP